MIVKPITIPFATCNDGLFVRWYFNGWNYELFSNRFTTNQESKVNGTQVTEKFSAISKVEKNTSRTNKINVTFGKDNITADSIQYYKGLLLAETVQIYQLQQWSKIEIDRGSFTIKPTRLNKYNIEAKAVVKELISSTMLITPPTEEPTELILVNELFDDWATNPPYNSIPAEWSAGFVQSANMYVEQLAPSGIMMKKIGAGANLYDKVNIYKPITPTQSGTFRLDIKINQIYHNSGLQKTVYITLGDKSFTTNTIGLFSEVFTDVTSFNRLTLGFGCVGEGTGNADIEFIKITKLL